jgi:hypothetical protein
MSAQLPGLVGLAEEHAAVPVRDDHGLDRVLLVLAGDEPVPVLAPGCRPADPDLGAVDDPGRPARAEMVDDLCQGPQPHTRADGAPSLGEQGPHLANGPSDGGAIHLEPAGEHVVRNPVSEVHEGGQKPVDEDQPVLRTRAHSTLPRPGRKPGLVPLAPQRTKLCDEFSDHVGRQARDPPVADDRCTRRVPHHMTMIGDQKLDASPPTVHELVWEETGESACTTPVADATFHTQAAELQELRLGPVSRAGTPREGGHPVRGQDDREPDPSMEAGMGAAARGQEHGQSCPAYPVSRWSDAPSATATWQPVPWSASPGSSTSTRPGSV